MSARPLTFNSAALLDGSAFAIPCPRAAIVAQLATFGIGLVATEPASDVHPLCIEVWRLRDGGFEALGLSQQQWYERTLATPAAISSGISAAMLEGSFNLLRGFTGSSRDARGAMSSVWRAGAASGMSAAAGGYRLGAAFGRALSELAGRTFGTYCEMMVSVPDAYLVGSEHEPLNFVLFMLTNNPVALWGDRWLGCGYRKRRASIRSPTADQVDVFEDARLALSCRIDGRAAIALAPDAPELSTFRDWFCQPLLGMPAPGRFALTRLERELDDSNATLWSAPTELRVGAQSELAALMGDGVSLSRLSEHAPWGAFHMQNVRVRLSNPWRP